MELESITMLLEKYPELSLVTSAVSNGNMSFLRGNPRKALENRRRFLNSIGLDLEKIVCLYTQHVNSILKVDQRDLGKGARSLENALKVDGLITNQFGVNLFLLTADCLPIRFYDLQNKAIGLVHAGWKGIDNGIIVQAVKSMKKEFLSDPKDLVVEIGPSIGPCCYKGLPSLEQVNDSRWQPYIQKANDGTYGLDLWFFVETQLKDAGVLAENIDNPKICTYHSGLYFSSRKFHAENLKDDYRFATVFGLRKMQPNEAHFQNSSEMKNSIYELN